MIIISCDSIYVNLLYVFSVCVTLKNLCTLEIIQWPTCEDPGKHPFECLKRRLNVVSVRIRVGIDPPHLLRKR
jgi:hypothetical protein